VDIDGAVDFGSTTAHAGNATFADNAKAIFGTGSDLEIYHTGAHSYIKEGGTGNLRILAENFTVRNPADNESMIIATPDAGVTLYYDSAAKLATTATGIDITGDIANASGDLTLDVAGDIILDADGADVIFKDGGTTFLEIDKDGNNARIKNPISDGDVLIQGTDSASVITALTFDMSAAGKATFNAGATTATFTRLEINATNTKLKGDLFANTDAAFDIGASGANRPRNLYLSNSITAADITTTGAGTFGSLDVDNFTLDGTTLALSSGSMTLDSASQIILKAAVCRCWS
jgi:hypothetical protein